MKTLAAELLAAADGISPLASGELPKPKLGELLNQTCVVADHSEDARARIVEALKKLAEEKAEGVLTERRRKSYDRIAMLIACCYQLERSVGDRAVAWTWVTRLRATYGRLSAFQAELDRVLP